MVSYRWVKDGNSKKMGVEDKEAYAWSFDFFLWFSILLPTQVSNRVKPCKLAPFEELHYSNV